MMKTSRGRSRGTSWCSSKPFAFTQQSFPQRLSLNIKQHAFGFFDGVLVILATLEKVFKPSAILKQAACFLFPSPRSSAPFLPWKGRLFQGDRVHRLAMVSIIKNFSCLIPQGNAWKRLAQCMSSLWMVSLISVTDLRTDKRPKLFLA